MRSHVRKGKIAYIWIFPDLTKAGPTVGVVVVVAAAIVSRNGIESILGLIECGRDPLGFSSKVCQVGYIRA